MSIRLRLALCYGALFAVILPLMTLLSYTIHARGQYDDLDRALIANAEHVVAETESSTTKPYLVQREKGFEIVFHLYSLTGILQESTPGTASLPAIDPRTVLRTPARAAFDGIVGLFPPLMESSAVTPDPGSVFGLFTTPQQRWRVYILPFHQAQHAGYLEALTPLGLLDISIQAFRLTLPILGLTSLLLALLGSWVIAGNALRPIALMTQTAQTMTLSRDLSRRIEIPTHHDELGKLATTFVWITHIVTGLQPEHRSRASKHTSLACFSL